MKMRVSSREEDCFVQFSSPIDSYSVPTDFTYSHYHQPHPLCQLAVHELQSYLSLEAQKLWEHDFNQNKEADLGKMFGVLVVSNTKGEIGYLRGFSGKIGGDNRHAGFVPPIVDMLREDGFFRKQEAVISKINKQVVEILESSDYRAARMQLEDDEKRFKEEIKSLKIKIKESKKVRKQKREEAIDKMSSDDYQSLINELEKQSIREHYTLKDTTRQWRKTIEDQREIVRTYEDRLVALKKERKKKSNSLQEQLFNEYQFNNQYGEYEALTSIFSDTPQHVPPSGAGDCAAPRLLQYAFENQMKPLAMTEFWWGKPPKSEIRKHGHYYPPCKGKCGPILNHMLKGLEWDAEQIKVSTDTLTIERIYEDESVLVLNKPSGLLSVPGKRIKDSVQLRMEKTFPEATGPMMVHRLDRATSGLMLIAKTKEAHEVLQNQFLTKEIKKRYVALLDGELKDEEGDVNLPLRVDLDDRPRQLVCDQYGKPAHTKWEMIERKNGRTRVYFYPLTGRTHQLRVHAAHVDGLNTPIVGDELYGEISNRLHLHAEQITFVHPVDRQEMTFSATVPF